MQRNNNNHMHKDTTIYVGKPPPGEESKPTGLTDPLQTSTVSTNGYKNYTSSNTFTIMQNWHQQQPQLSNKRYDLSNREVIDFVPFRIRISQTTDLLCTNFGSQVDLWAP